MTRGARLAVFLIAATAGNIAVSVLAFLGLLWIYSLTLSRILPPTATIWAVAACFVIALVISVFAYKAILAALRGKFGLDEKLGITDKALKR